MNLHTITFSPTGTSAKVLQGVLSGMDLSAFGEVRHEDITHGDAAPCTFGSGDTVIIAAPVYGGKIAPLIKVRMHDIRAEGARCIVIAVYGNRAFEGAVKDLASFMEEQGFSTVGAAAFVGEHSYSTPGTPIAAGRPDAADLEEARAFGQAIAAKAATEEWTPVDVEALKDIPSSEEALGRFREFIAGYQRQQAEAPQMYLPEVDAERCTLCGMCVAVCPTEAIGADCHSVDKTKCIKCCACVKVCPSHARSLYTPFARPLSENFNVRKTPAWII